MQGKTSRIDITGKRFGRLLAVKPTEKRVNRNVVWELLCDCGATHYAPTGSLKGKTTSCGCYGREQRIASTTRHGLAHSSEYLIWQSIRSRCGNPNDRAYPRYGGRGIILCARWANDFMAFYADMGPRPSTQHSIDRKDNNGPYSPENCRWATKLEQTNNTRTNHHLTVNGETHTIAEWSRITGVNSRTISSRLNYGWSETDAVTKPLNPGGKGTPKLGRTRT